MSVNFEWPAFSEAFYTDAREMLAQALNKGQKPPIIADRIEVQELHMGTIPPELEILEIGDLSTDRFRGIFRLTYQGDAFIVLKTKVQANPLNVPRPSLDILGSPRMVFAAAPLVVPMTLRLSDLSLRAIVVLVVSRQKGITLVFKNDPLESVQVSSSFDGVESVAGYIQREIEGQLREAFRNDLPAIIHRLSQKWLSGEVKKNTEGAAKASAAASAAKAFGKDAKIETRTSYLTRDGEKARRALMSRMSALSIGAESYTVASDVDTSFGTSVAGNSAPPSSRLFSTKRSSLGNFTRSSMDKVETSDDPLENYDPTYGLRPDSIPTRAEFADYERVLRSNEASRGLGDALAADTELDDFDEGDADEGDEFDGSWDKLMRVRLEQARLQLTPTRARRSDARPFADEEDDLLDAFETIPAVGGGTITRPRVVRALSSRVDGSYEDSSASGSPSTATYRSRGDHSSATAGDRERNRALGGRIGSAPANLSALEGSVEHLRAMASGTSTPRFPFSSFDHGTAFFPSTPSPQRTASRPRPGAHRSTFSTSTDRTSQFPSTRSSSYSSPASSVPSPSEIMPNYPAKRPDALSLLSRSPSSLLDTSFEDDQPITLHPHSNETCALISTLTKSNQTLSPFTRSHEFFTARSIPNVVSRLSQDGFSPATTTNATTTKSETRGGPQDRNMTFNAPIKAKRKRLHRIGAAKLLPPPLLSTPLKSSERSSTDYDERRDEDFMYFQPAPTRSLRHLPPTVRKSGYYAESSIGRDGLVSYAPSELSEYFPSKGITMDKGRVAGLRGGRDLY